MNPAKFWIRAHTKDAIEAGKHLSTARRETCTWRAQALQACLFVICACLLVVIAGCRDSDALKEIIHDQSASVIDYDDISKIWINDSSSDEDSDQVSSLEISDEDPDSDQIQNLIIYSVESNTEDFTAKQSIFAAYPDFIGLESSDTVFFYSSDSVDALEREVTSTNEESEENTEDSEEPKTNQETEQQSSQQTGSVSINSDGGTGMADSGATVAGEAVADATGATASDTEDTSSPHDDATTSAITNYTDGVGEWKNPTIAFEISNLDADIPSFDSVAAYGQLAIIVQMIGGDGALAATDAETRASFSKYGVACSAVEAWTSSDGDISTNPQNIDVEAIVASGAQAILVTDAQSYAYYLSDEQLQYLEDNGVQWVVLRVMNKSSYIKSNVTTVGEMLQGSAKAAYGSEAQSRADEYVSRHDTMVTTVNGGLAQVTNNSNITSSIAYQSNGTSGESFGDTDGVGWSNNAATYTVLIDSWDAGAFYSSDSLTLSAGIAFASIGYSTTPVSYYIQAGGSINTAAALHSATASGKVAVHQFAGGWASSSVQNITLSNVVWPTNNRVSALLDSGLNVSNTQLGWGLGSSAMPKIIVTSSSIKEAILASSASETGTYHAYSFAGSDLIANALGITYTTYSGGLTTMWSCIGNNGTSGIDGDANPVYSSGVIDADDILVNPSGLFCDWTEGTVESFLESGWIAAYINGTYDANTWANDVVDFYRWAYGITITISAITG